MALRRFGDTPSGPFLPPCLAVCLSFLLQKGGNEVCCTGGSVGTDVGEVPFLGRPWGEFGRASLGLGTSR